MSRDIERRIGNLLDSSKITEPANGSTSASNHKRKQLSGSNEIKTTSTEESNSSEKKLSVELKQKQERIKVFVVRCTFPCILSFRVQS